MPELVRQVESGGEVSVITRHGKSVARFTSPTGSTSPNQRQQHALKQK
jgi:antitoxin (DNA-binding transcriptional repressor) of toxin-antitoxin stability system